jgi:NTP pyrophosphatase (non-canonical NTP hydrolase)
MKMKTISLPQLNQLNPTLESTALKLMEEAGELAQVIGKFRGLSGEPTAVRQRDSVVVEEISKELLDVAQTAITMMFVMEDQYGIDIDALLQQHIGKLQAKKYIVAATDAP